MYIYVINDFNTYGGLPKMAVHMTVTVNTYNTDKEIFCVYHPLLVLIPLLREVLA